MKRHLEILNYCRRYFNEYQIFPLLSEIGKHFNIIPEAVRQQLNRLVGKGYLVKHGWKKRGYTIVVKDIFPREKSFIRKIIDKIKGHKN